MTTGIRVIWPDIDGKVVDAEIDYFCGIDIDQLDHIPEFTTGPTFLPRYDAWVVYAVSAHCERNLPGEVRLVVVYDPANNPEFAKEWGDEIIWGTNTIVLQQGSRHGHCEWLRDGATEFVKVRWEAFDFGSEPCARPGYTYRGSKREAGFRTLILACDDYRCVLTGEATTKALDVAHLIPAANGENDLPSNGITLPGRPPSAVRCCLFTFAIDGRVVALAAELSEAYLGILRSLRLPSPTLERVGATLTHPQFLNRLSAA